VRLSISRSRSTTQGKSKLSLFRKRRRHKAATTSRGRRERARERRCAHVVLAVPFSAGARPLPQGDASGSPKSLCMHLTDLLTSDRVAIRRNGGNGHAFSKNEALSLLASLLATGSIEVPPTNIERVLVEREQLQSTGIGDGVAIPHGALSELDSQVASLLIAPDGVEFAAIDGHKVTILFAVVGPKRATGEHLKTLARVSRLLRNRGFREQLVAAPTPGAAYDLVAKEEADQK
jgi:PTS system nitrogen regulatory IIA component